MDRTTTLAASITLTATMAFGSMAFAALGGSSMISFGAKVDAIAPGTAVAVAVTEPAPAAVDTSVVAAPAPHATEAPAVEAPAATTAHVTVRSASAAPTATSTATTAAPTTTVKAAATTAPATTVKATTTTAPATTVAAPVTTVKPQLYTASGQVIPSSFTVPLSWRTKVIPSYPAGCRAGQLEDNGTWNCQ